MYSNNDYRYYLEHQLVESDDFLAHYGVKGMKWKDHNYVIDPRLRERMAKGLGTGGLGINRPRGASNPILNRQRRSRLLRGVGRQTQRNINRAGRNLKRSVNRFERRGNRSLRRAERSINRGINKAERKINRGVNKLGRRAKLAKGVYKFSKTKAPALKLLRVSL